MRNLLFTILVAVGLSGCAALDKAAVYTENGIKLADSEWDRAYRDRAALCSRTHAPETEGMERCFGAYYDADGDVAVAVTSAVALLRTYWLARAYGEKPDWKVVAKQVGQLFEDLPPEAREYFDRIRGVR